MTTSEGKSARDAAIEALQVPGYAMHWIPEHLQAAIEHATVVIDRESRLSIAAALEMTAKHQAHYIFDPLVGRVTRASCACGLEFNPFDPGCPQWEAHILSLTEADVAHARAEHDRAVQLDEASYWVDERHSRHTENIFSCKKCEHIRALASATEAASPEDSGGNEK